MAVPQAFIASKEFGDLEKSKTQTMAKRTSTVRGETPFLTSFVVVRHLYAITTGTN